MRLLRAATLLVTAMLLLSVVASVPIDGAAKGGDSSDSVDDGEPIESFAVEFTSASPENPDDLSLQWNLSPDAENVSTVHVEIINESGDPINAYKPGETAVSNPFTVSNTKTAGQGTDIAVDNLSAVALSLKLPPGHCGRVDSVAVSVSNESGSVGDPVIERPADCTASPTGGFNVTIQDYDKNLRAGETGSLTAAVTNTAATKDSQDIRVRVNGTTVEQTNLTLEANETKTLNASYETTESDVGDIEIVLKSDDDTANRTVTIGKMPVFVVRIHEYDEQVMVGETINVTAVIQNTAHTEKTQTVRFLVNGTTIEQTTVTLRPNSTKTMNFSTQTNKTDAGTLEIAVESEDSAAIRTVAIQEPPFLMVTITDAPDRVAAGDPVTVTALVENRGAYSALQNVTLTDFDGEVVSTQENLSLGPGASETVTLQWSTEAADMGNGTISVSSENQTATAGLVVTEPAVDSITATLAAPEIQETAQTTITVNASYTDGSTRTVTRNATLSAENQRVATVNDTGMLTAHNADSVKITAVFRNKTDVALLTVTSVGTSSPGDSSNRDPSSGGATAGDTSNGADDADTDSGSDDGKDTDDSPGDDPTPEDPGGDNPTTGPSDTDPLDREGTDSTAASSDSEETEQTVIALFPALGVVVAPLVLMNRKWWLDYQ